MRLLDDINVVVILGLHLGLFLKDVGLLFLPFLSYILMLILWMTIIKMDLSKVAGFFLNVKLMVVPLLLVFVFQGLAVLPFSFLLPQDLFLGLVISCIMPCGVSVPFLVDYFKGDKELALSLTATITLLSPVLIPLSTLLFIGSIVEIDILGVLSTVVLLIIVPTILATLTRRYLKTLTERVTEYSQSVSMFFLLILIWGVMAPNAEAILAYPILLILLILLAAIPSSLGYAAGYLLGKTEKEKRALAFVSGYKNGVLGVVLAYSLFSGQAALATIAYIIANNLLLIPLKIRLIK